MPPLLLTFLGRGIYSSRGSDRSIRPRCILADNIGNLILAVPPLFELLVVFFMSSYEYFHPVTCHEGRRHISHVSCSPR